MSFLSDDPRRAILRELRDDFRAAAYEFAGQLHQEYITAPEGLNSSEMELWPGRDDGVCVSHQSERGMGVRTDWCLFGTTKARDRYHELARWGVQVLPRELWPTGPVTETDVELKIRPNDTTGDWLRFVYLTLRREAPDAVEEWRRGLTVRRFGPALDPFSASVLALDTVMDGNAHAGGKGKGR